MTNLITTGILAVTRAAEACDRCDNPSHACRGGGLSVGRSATVSRARRKCRPPIMDRPRADGISTRSSRPRRSTVSRVHCGGRPSSVKRPEEINDVLLLLSSQPIETFDDLICLAAIALVISNDFHQVGRPSIMEEEDALSNAPERSGSEFVGAGTTLRDAVGEAFAHVVDEKVGVKIRCLIGKRSARAGRGAARDLCARGKRGRMAVDTTNPCKSGAAVLAGRGSGCGWGQHPHEVGKGFDV